MKRIKLLILLAIPFLNCFAQNLHKITLNGTTVSVEGDRLLPVEGEEQVWEIDLKSDTEEFQLISKNNSSRVEYKLNGNYVYAIPGGYINYIPYKGNSYGFYNSAHLVLVKDSLPITISVNGKVIATFRLKKRITYQKFNTPQNSVFNVGDTLDITKENSNGTDILISNISVEITDGHRIVNLKDGIITEKILGDKDSIDNCQIIYTIQYTDGYIDKKRTSNNVKIKKNNNGDIKFYIVGLIVVLLLLVALLSFRKKKQNNYNDDAESKSTNGIISSILFWKRGEKIEKKDKAEENDKTESPSQTNLLDTFQVDHNYTAHNLEAEVAIKDYVRQINELRSRISELERAQDSVTIPNASELGNRIKELEKSEKAKLKIIEDLSLENSRKLAENVELKNQLSVIISDNASKKDLRNKIEELKDDKNKLTREKQSKERDLVAARKDITNLKSKIKEKDDKISEINKQKDEAESNLRIEKESIIALQKKISSFSKQTYYIYAIDDAMHAVDSSLKCLFIGIRDENLMKRLAQPVLSGTAGLDTGLESYLNEWENSVYNNQKQFFGDDVLNLNDDFIKEKLAEFLEQLALRDSFGKLVRLYTMTNVGWINERMVAAGFNIDAIQTLFATFKNLFTLFNIEILYPRLFVDRFDSNHHKDNMRCEIFNYFEPSAELLAQLKKRENENLIVDVTRIGIPNSKTPTRRNAMVSLPNF